MEPARERAASIAILTSIPMVAQLIGGRAVRDALFLTEYDAVFLPRVMLAAAVLSLGAAVAVGRLMPRRGPRTTAVALALLNGGAFAIEAALLDARPAIVSVATYLHVSVVGALVVSAFSSIVNERFDPLYAKTVVAQVGTGAALGGVLGGVAALFLADTFEFGTVLYGLGGLSLLIALGVWNIGAPSQPHRRRSKEAGSGLQSFRKDDYLRRIALTIVLLGAVGVFVDYAMKAEADARFESSADLLSFFAVFYMATSLLTFVMQAGVAKPLLQKIGLGGTMVVLPLTVAVSAGLGTVWTRLWTATVARGTQTVVSSSLFRSGYELLYTPVPPMKKRATKAVIDVACNRIGYGLGSCVVMAIVALSATAEIATSSVLAVATVTALVSAWMIRKLNDGYVHELASSLRDGSIALQPDDIVDATTLHTLAQTGGVMTRSQLLESIEELERSRESDLRERDHQAWVTQLSDLLSDQPERVLNVLLDESLNVRLAAPVIDLLGNDVFARTAYQALERMGPEITGQLVDAMLRSGSPVKVRRRIPRLLRKLEDPRAVEGLLAGLRDREFDVRCRCGHALADLKQANGSLNLREDLIIEFAEQELAADPESWQHQPLRDEVSPDMRTEIDALLEDREDRNLQHVFTLLSLALDRDAVILSLRALSSQDDNLRGTALEYLHNILPEKIRESLWPRLTERSERLRVRSAKSSPDELLKSMRSLMLDRDRLVK
jgi:MFS family permease